MKKTKDLMIFTSLMLLNGHCIYFFSFPTVLTVSSLIPFFFPADLYELLMDEMD